MIRTSLVTLRLRLRAEFEAIGGRWVHYTYAQDVNARGVDGTVPAKYDGKHFFPINGPFKVYKVKA